MHPRRATHDRHSLASWKFPGQSLAVGEMQSFRDILVLVPEHCISLGEPAGHGLSEDENVGLRKLGRMVPSS